MISDVDYSILMTKLEALEFRIKKLEDSVVVLNAYVDTQLKNKYQDVNVRYLGCTRCGLYTCNGTACINSGYQNHVASVKVPKITSKDVLSKSIVYSPPDDITPDDITPDDIQKDYINYDDILGVL